MNELWRCHNMTTKDLSNIILDSMVPYLNPNQLNLLSATLIKELYDYELVKKTTDIATFQDTNINDMYLKKYAIEKRIQGMSEQTIYQYVKTTKNFLEKLQKDFKQITKDDVTYYFAYLMKSSKASNISLDNTRRYISPFFTWCLENDYIEKNPFKGVKLIKVEKKIKEVLSDEDIVLLKDNCINEREKALIDFLLSTGVRVSELLRVEVKDINLSNGEVIIYGQKTRTWRKVYLGAEALKHITDYLNHRNYQSEYLFGCTRRPYGSICKQTMEKELRIIADRAGVKKHCTVHLFRRTLATRLYKKGMDMKYIASLLGHSVRVLEECYLIIDNEDIKNNYSKYAIL